MFNSMVSSQLSELYMITIDDNGVFLILSIVVIVIGAILLLKGIREK